MEQIMQIKEFQWELRKPLRLKIKLCHKVDSMVIVLIMEVIFLEKYKKILNLDQKENYRLEENGKEHQVMVQIMQIKVHQWEPKKHLKLKIKLCQKEDFKVIVVIMQTF